MADQDSLAPHSGSPESGSPKSGTPKSGSSKPRRWRRWILGGVGSVLGLTILGIFATPWLVNTMIRPQVEAALTQRLHAPVSIDRLTFSWFTGFDIQAIRMGNPTATPAGDLLTIARIRGDIRLLSLLAGQIVVRHDVVIESPQLRVLGLADGSTTLQRFLDGLPPPQAEPSASELIAKDVPSPPPPALPVVIGTLRIHDFGGTYINQQQQRLTIPPLAAVMTLDTFDRPLQVMISTASGDLTLKSTVLLGHQGRLALEQLSGTLDYHLAPEWSVGMRPWLALVPHLNDADPVVSGDGHLEFSAPTSVQGQGTFAFTMNHGVLTLPSSNGALAVRYVLSPGTVQVAFKGASPGPGMYQGVVELASPWASLTVDSSAGPVVSGSQSTGPQSTVTLRTRLDVGELAQCFPGLVGDPRLSALVGMFEGTVTATTTSTANGTAGVASVSVSGSGISERQHDGTLLSVLESPHIAGDLQFDTATGQFAVAHGVVQITGVDVALDGAVTVAKNSTPIQGSAKFLDTMQNLTLKATCQADLSALTAAVHRLLPTLGTSIAAEGRLRGEVSVVGAADRPEVLAVHGEITADALKIRGISSLPNLDLSPIVEARVIGEISRSGHDVAVTSLSLTTELVSVTGQLAATVAPGGGIAALQVALRGSADLNRLVQLAQKLGFIPPDTIVRGGRSEWSFEASTTAAQGEISLAVTVSIPQFMYRDATRSLPQQDVHVALRGVLRDLGHTLVIDSASQITATTLQAKIQGILKDVRGEVRAEGLMIDATYLPESLNGILQSMGKGQLSGTVPQTSHLALSGPLRRAPQQSLVSWVELLNTHDSQIGYGTWSHAGFTVVGLPLPLRLADGTATLTYDCTVNGGPTAVQITAVLPQESCDFQMSTTKLHLTSDLAWLVAYLNPIFKDEQQGALTGDASVALAGTWRGSFTPLDMRQAIGTSLAATGTLSASKVSVAGSKVVLAIVNGVSGGSAADLAEIAPTDFVISRGVLSYRDMQVRIGGITLICSGTANVVTDALDITIVAPFSNSLQATKAGKYLPKTLTLPIRGTLTKPIYDFNAAVKTALKEALEKAGKEELAGQVGGLLEGLLKKKKEPVPPAK